MGCCNANKNSERVITRKKPARRPYMIRDSIGEKASNENISDEYNNDFQEKNNSVLNKFTK